jgi:Kef-type K+ transport system membrane component KefB
MAEQVETHVDNVTSRRPDANRTCSAVASVNQSPVRFVATALLLCAALTAETAAQTRYSTQGMRVAGTICVDAATGAVLAQTTADYPGSPASVTKLMTFLLVLEDIRDGRTTLRSRVGVGLLGAAVFDDVLVILGLSILLALTMDGGGLADAQGQ